MNKSPTRTEVYLVMAVVAVAVLFAQDAYYRAAERLTIRIEAAIERMPKMQQQQSIVVPSTRDDAIRDVLRKRGEID